MYEYRAIFFLIEWLIYVTYVCSDPSISGALVSEILQIIIAKGRIVMLMKYFKVEYLHV